MDCYWKGWYRIGVEAKRRVTHQTPLGLNIVSFFLLLLEVRPSTREVNNILIGVGRDRFPANGINFLRTILIEHEKPDGKQLHDLPCKVFVWVEQCIVSFNLISLWSRTWWVVIKNMRIAQLLALRKQHAMLLTFISPHLSHERRKCNLLQKFKERRAERISNEDIIIRSPRFRNYKDNTTRVLVRLFCI